jgi:NAD(P)-dependent dehydrogenase (short-subunit alcohol dehydrogenase family)
MPGLDDKIAVVTGAADGIGRATSVMLAARGARVLLVDVDADGLTVTEKRIADAGGQAHAHLADVRDSAQVQGYVEAALETFGPIDAFFNNAGIQGPVAPLTEFPEDGFDRVIAVNLRGVFLGLKYVLPGMVERGEGSVVNTASMGSVGGVPGVAGYVAAKHGVLGLTRVAALEVARAGVRVNAVLPGNIRTKMAAAGDAAMSGGKPSLDDMSGPAATVPQGRVGEPEEIAATVCFLVSDDSRHITGAAVPVDGGITAQVYPQVYTQPGPPPRSRRGQSG